MTRIPRKADDASSENEAKRRISTSSLALSERRLVKCCLLCGPITMILLLIGFAAGVLFPPPSPSFSAEETVQYYARRQTGLKVTVLTLALAGITVPAFAIGVGSQLAKIPTVHRAVLSVQLISGALAGASSALVSIFLATTIYRLDRDPTLTQLMSDLTWTCFALNKTSLILQELAIMLGILSDRRPSPLYSRWIVWLNIPTTVLLFLQMLAYFFHAGPFCWNGVIGFWVPLFSLASQIAWDAVFFWETVGDRGQGVVCDHAHGSFV
ncbi:hypothetical protein P175DRAFT_0527620 [Aspergillus ochraceoroseus IBT 24754]|uniref:Uncharacterized protein n=1 Tax=Aspergillus ochraceoroseus IBT 24754 TaxID=1392256 RepID=A0A2T5M6J8_9EURO|nr:uncharacterized protein P175DRAFT_0527620 [Aspergillus ochraceoroseus IBT 24754]PTU24165.1 hypothetical protein P175DRAFT_0527620 [Aspergillus ochraceoroseus IBT 24754]